MLAARKEDGDAGVPDSWHSSAEYDFPLSECRDAASVLFWLGQVSDKYWASPKVLADLLAAFDALLGFKSMQGRRRNPVPELKKFGWL